MRQSRPSIICAVIASVLAVPAAAQNPQCDALAFPSARPACNTAVDAIRAFHPVAGMIVGGGNPVIGTSGSLGGIGHLTITARVNAIKASLPNPDSASQSQVPSSFHGAIPAPIVEAALGLLRGRGGFLSVDALGSAVLLPTSGVSGLSVDSNAAHIGGAALGIGYGARVGILGGTFPIPALSVSWMHRTLPRIQYGNVSQSTFGTGDQFQFDMDLSRQLSRGRELEVRARGSRRRSRRRSLLLQRDEHQFPRQPAEPGERADRRHQPEQHARGGVPERWTEPRRPQARRRARIPDGEGPALHDELFQLRPQGGPCLRRHRAPLRLLTGLPKGRRWGAPSTSHCEVGGASRRIPSSARSSSGATRPSAQGFTPNTAGRTRKSWRWRTPATGRAVRRWW